MGVVVDGEVVVVGATVVEVLGVWSGALTGRGRPRVLFGDNDADDDGGAGGRHGGESSQESEGRRGAPSRVR